MSTDDYVFDPKDWKIASTKKMMYYSFGFILTLYMLLAYNSLIFYFYEVEVGLQTELVSLAIILFTVWTIITSPIIGYLTDRPFKWSKKWGFRAPWIVISAFPTILFYLLLYAPPNIDAKSNSFLIFLYLLIISCLFGFFMSIFRQHFEGGFANQFREDFERRRASAIAFIFPGLILFILSLLPLFIIVYGDKSTFFLTALISIIILASCVIFLIPGIHESEEVKMRYLQGYEDTDRISFLKMMKIGFKQRNFTTTIITSTLVNIATALNSASGIYFFKDVLGLPLYLSMYPTAVYFIALMISLPYWVSFARKHGSVKTYTIGLLLSGIAYIPYLWVTTLEEVIIFAALRGVAGSCFTVMVLPVISDCYDEVTLACERHQEATLHGIRAIFLRSSIIFQAIIIGWIHIITGYNQDPNAIQTPLAIWGIRVHRALIPMILCFTACIVMMIFYDLKGEKINALKQMLREKGL